MYAVFTVVRVLEMTGLEMGPEEWIEFAWTGGKNNMNAWIH